MPEVATNVETLTFAERRLALDALGVGVRVFASDAAPRYKSRRASRSETRLLWTHAHSDGQVVAGAFLLEVGRGQVHRDAAHREAEPAVADCRPRHARAPPAPRRRASPRRGSSACRPARCLPRHRPAPRPAPPPRRSAPSPACRAASALLAGRVAYQSPAGEETEQVPCATGQRATRGSPAGRCARLLGPVNVGNRWAAAACPEAAAIARWRLAGRDSRLGRKDLSRINSHTHGAFGRT